MKIYLAAIYSNGLEKDGRGLKKLTESEKKHRANVRYILESYHYIHKENKIQAIRNDAVKVFLDSGAFSAFLTGVEINIDDYCDYIKRNHHIIEVASVLDGIGDAQKTFDNQCYMEQKGTRPLPCFHYGEDEGFLQHYVEKYDYITLGGMVPISTPQLRFWLDTIWGNYLTNSDGSAKIKVHGFGMTSFLLMKRYPWYSVDSSSWVQLANYGHIYIPPNLKVLTVSNDSSHSKRHWKHFKTMPMLYQNKLLDMINSNGFCIERLSEHFVCRWVWNMFAFREMNDMINRDKPIFKKEQQTLFH